MTLTMIFWLAAAVVFCAYAGYPLALLLLSRLHQRPIRPVGAPPRSISVVLAAYNEQSAIARRITEFCAHIARAGLDGEVVVVSDGSTDATAAAARACDADNVDVTIIEMPQNGGKALALNAGVAAAKGQIIIFADSRQRWDEDALPCLIAPFADPQVGAVSGELLLESAPGVLSGVGLYWKYEKAVRKLESRTGSVCGVTGAIAAVRKELYRPLPAGTILDDVHWPLGVAMQSRRVVFEPQAKAYDRLPDRARDEFRRKVRTLCGNFQLLINLPSAIVPVLNPVWWRFLSHKLARLAVPWALIAMLITSALLPGALYDLALAAQLTVYAFALAGMLYAPASRLRIASAAASFVVLNAAAFAAFWIWITGRSCSAWKKTVYKPATLATIPRRA